MTAYYNEIDKYAAQWLRNLIAAGHIAPGEVDERSIEDVTPDDLRGYRQCHFFAGIGVWSLALRRAGWADDQEIWTGSCPCQPFSAAGAGAGFADERHLWPAFHHLIAERRPAKVLGEQVASSHVNPWIDLVQSDLEALGYRFAGVPFPSAGIGAPHIRDRLYWVAHPEVMRRSGQHVRAGRRLQAVGTSDLGGAVRLAYANNDGLGTRARPELHHAESDAEPRGGVVALDNPVRPGPTNGFWRDADWLGCTDGKFRPVEPGTFPLAHGAANRVGRLRAYGNAINAEAARVFIQAVMECEP